MADTSRVIVRSPADEFLFEIAPADVFARERGEEINGEHSLEITTTVVLKKEMRLLTADHTGKWREWVVMGEDADHASGLAPIGTYYCVWSLQHDLALTKVDKMPGTQSPVTAGVALADALSGTKRWTVGTVTVTTTGGASMWYKSGWDALATVVDVWGGEVDATITVANDGTITARRVDLYDKMGQQTAKRRFDWGHDLKGIRRKVDEAPMAVRIIPRGKGEETGTGGYGRKITIESVNGGVEWLQNDETAPLYRLPDGDGGWEYPTIVVENGNIEDPQELKDWGLSVLEDYTTPKVTYESDVMQLAQAGMDVKGVELGDAVQCVDRGFSEDGLRVSGRVMKMQVNELDETDVRLTIGHLAAGLAGSLSSISKLTATVSAMNGGSLSTADYLNRLLDRINGEINATGGYTYITYGQGMRTYDKAVSDPLVGAEADKVVEIKGGTIRIADSRTAQGEWEWRTVFESGHIAADLVTAANLTAGYIGNASGSYWDLDNDVLQIATTASIGDRTVLEALAGIDATITDVTIEYAQNQSEVNPPTGGWSPTAPTWREGYYIWQRVATTYGTGEEAVTVRSEPTCISGADGERGMGIKSIREQYYLSTSNTEQVGGEWSFDQTAWQPNHFIWIRSYITWDDDTATTTTAVLAQAINAASQAADDAAKVATNYLTFDSENGLDVGYSGTSAKTRINAKGMEVYDGEGNSAAFFGIDSNGRSYARVGKVENFRGNIEMKARYYNSMSIILRSGTYEAASINYGPVVKNGSYNAYNGAYFTFGNRTNESRPGNNSMVIGTDNRNEGEDSLCGGARSIIRGLSNNFPETKMSLAFGESCRAYGDYAAALNYYTLAGDYQTAVGRCNVQHNDDTYLFIVGNSYSSSSRSDAMYVDMHGDLWIAGTLTQNSDRRLKEHQSYLGEDAVEFVRALKPALYTKDGERHVGFYAQDVREAEPDGWDTVTVTEEHTDESLDFDPLTLDYTALIAPLVAYAQSLEKRIEALEARLA